MDIRKCCDLLDLCPGYSQEDLKQAYKDLVQVWHPDRFTHNQRLQDKAETKLKQLNKAYEILERALADRERAQALRASISQKDPVNTEVARARAVYEQTVAWQSRPAASAWRLQVSFLLWSAGVFVGLVSLIVLLSLIAANLEILLVLLIVAAGYVGWRWWEQR